MKFPHVSLRGKGTRGVTLLELVIAVGVVTLALLALMSSVTSASGLQETARERSIAYNAARQEIELMRNTAFSQIYSTYKSGTSLNTFTVTGLNAIPGTPVGQVFFPADSNGALREDFYTVNASLATTLGMAAPGKDLNRDGAIDSKDHSGDYKILPVMVQIEWQSIGRRPTMIQVATFITVY